MTSIALAPRTVSTGCMMSQRMAFEASDIVAAVGCMAGYLQVPSSPDVPGRTPRPILEVHATSTPMRSPIEQSSLAADAALWPCLSPSPIRAVIDAG